jgi:DNA-3-methyladenine glycosylase I
MAWTKEKQRCGWALSDPIYIDYHDKEWGVPIHDDRKLFEFLILEGAQAGLSWLTILRRRDGYRKAFCNFDPKKVAKLGEKDVKRLMKDSAIIRHEGKIRAAIENAKAFLEIQKEFKSFDAYSWRFVNGKTILGQRRELKEIPAVTPESKAFSKDLKKRGFKFVGPIIMYAHMQAVGMVNDHVVTCFKHKR